MNGASLIRTLVANGVDTCFTNPGTSEMHFVAALDTVPEMHGVLALFEGVATGAADGYARMAERPACTLLHLGPGLGNGLANLHNARKAATPVVSIVGDHATVPQAVRRAARVRHRDGWRATSRRSCARRRSPTRSPPTRPTPSPPRTGRRARSPRSILPADVSWSDVTAAPSSLPLAERQRARAVGDDTIRGVAQALRSGDAGGDPCRRAGVPARRARTGSSHRRGHRRQALVRDVPGPPRARCGHPRRRSHRLSRRVRRDAARRTRAPRARRRQVAGDVLRLSRKSERSRAPGLHRAHPRAAHRRRDRRAHGLG